MPETQSFKHHEQSHEQPFEQQCQSQSKSRRNKQQQQNSREVNLILRIFTPICVVDENKSVWEIFSAINNKCQPCELEHSKECAKEMSDGALKIRDQT